MRLTALCAAFTVAWGCGGASAAELSEEEELALGFGEKSFVSIATGTQVPVARAPSVATVITAEDILALGAIDLDEVLETVPGLHVSRSPIAYSPIYTIRGVRGTITNPQVLMLVNGVRVTSVYIGDRGIQWSGLPLENIARIEVIRGPGSALYGADAIAGVINLITKTAADIGGTQVGVRAGSFRSGDAWALHGGKWGAVDVAAYLRVGSTEGAKRIVSADAQTGLDAIFGQLGVPPVSLAPGPTHLGYKAVDASLELAHEKWRLRAAFKRRYDEGTGVGVAQALDPTHDIASERFTSDLGWHDPQFTRDWALSVEASFMHYHEQAAIVLFPPGTNLGAGFFSDGMIGAPSKWERHGRLDASATYAGWRQHRIRLGAGYEKENLYKIRERKNFNPDFSPIGSGSVADIVDVSDTVPFIRPQSRNLRYVYAQDEWNFAKDWTLTAGVRHDRYSDFGGTTNPRLALVWEAAYNLTAKLLCGSAFRAPAFAELHVINNPVLIGNPNLSPERMQTWEAVAAWQAAPKLLLGVNAFHYRLSDIIRADSNFNYQNAGRQTGNGLEFEATWDASKDVRVSGNVGHQRSVDKTSGQDAGMAPHDHVNLRADWRFMRGWRSNAQLNWVGERQREPGDSRPPLAGYATLDLTLRTERNSSPWEFAVSVRNLFNADAREPSPFGVPFVPIPNDFPLPGRSVYVEARWRL